MTQHGINGFQIEVVTRGREDRQAKAPPRSVAKTRPIEIRNEIGQLSHWRCAMDRSIFPVCALE
jgi:hypothetical protein